MGNKLGWQGKLYRNTGTFATPTWAEIADVGDVNPQTEKEKATVIKRGSEWAKVLAKVKSLSIEVQLLHAPGDADHQALRDAYFGNTMVDIAVADGDIATSGTEYFRAECEVTGWGRNEPVGDAMTTPVTLEPSAESANDPQHVVVA